MARPYGAPNAGGVRGRCHLRASVTLSNRQNVPMLKVELHSHSADDPYDRIGYSTRALIDRAAELGYDALAVTLHDRQLDTRPLAAYARERGITLIPGIERTIEGKHVLLLNFRRGTEDVHSFDDLRRLRQREPGLVVAPHPFFPHSSCLRGLLDRLAELFDAVEWNAMFTSTMNFNRQAVRWAAAHGKPVVGNGDVHRLRQLGTTFSLVEAEPHPDAICQAVVDGRVQVHATPLSWLAAAGLIAELASDSFTRTLLSSKRAPAPVEAGM
jgi:predicted metal-dependent phosphoesterase TrpH